MRKPTNKPETASATTPQTVVEAVTPVEGSLVATTVGSANSDIVTGAGTGEADTEVVAIHADAEIVPSEINFANTPQSDVHVAGAGHSAGPAWGALRKAPEFVNADGSLRLFTADDPLFEVTLARSVKIDGVTLEHSKTYWVPHDIGDALFALDALEIDD